MKLRKKIEEYDELVRLKKEAIAYLELYEDDRMKPVLGHHISQPYEYPSSQYSQREDTY